MKSNLPNFNVQSFACQRGEYRVLPLRGFLQVCTGCRRPFRPWKLFRRRRAVPAAGEQRVDPAVWPRGVATLRGRPGWRRRVPWRAPRGSRSSISPPTASQEPRSQSRRASSCLADPVALLQLRFPRTGAGRAWGSGAPGVHGPSLPRASPRTRGPSVAQRTTVFAAGRSDRRATTEEARRSPHRRRSWTGP